MPPRAINPLRDPRRKAEFWGLVDTLCRRRGIARRQLWKELETSRDDRNKLQTGELWFGRRPKILSKMIQILRPTPDERRKMYVLNNVDVEGVDASSSPYADLFAQMAQNHGELLAQLGSLTAAVPDATLVTALGRAMRLGSRSTASAEEKVQFYTEILQILGRSERTEVRQARGDVCANRAFTRAVKLGFMKERGQFEGGMRLSEKEAVQQIAEDAASAFVLWAESPSRPPTFPFKLLLHMLVSVLRASGVTYAERQKHINRLLAPFGLRHEESGPDLDNPLPPRFLDRTKSGGVAVMQFSGPQAGELLQEFMRRSDELESLHVISIGEDPPTWRRHRSS